MHGDLYAHNIMADAEGTPLLGDFGAATLYDPSYEHASLLEGIEVRAFGCLMEDLLDRLDPLDRSKMTSSLLSSLQSLQQACVQRINDKCPTFSSLHRTLLQSREIYLAETDKLNPPRDAGLFAGVVTAVRDTVFSAKAFRSVLLLGSTWIFLKLIPLHIWRKWIFGRK